MPKLQGCLASALKYHSCRFTVKQAPHCIGDGCTMRRIVCCYAAEAALLAHGQAWAYTVPHLCQVAQG